MDPLLDFSGKTALVTGAASGLGHHLALELARRGAKLVLADLNAGGLLDSVRDAEALGATVASESGDVAEEDHARALVGLTVEQFGRLDMAVNNAGVAPRLAPLTELDAGTLDRQLAVNTRGVALGMKHQLRVMAAQRDGVILNVSSVAGLGGTPGGGSYGAAKHAVIGLTRTAAAEFGRFNVRINAICPFFTLTPMIDNPELNPTDSVDDVNATLGRGCPMKRVARVEEIVSVMLMMLSPANTFMNGVALPVDGGHGAI